MPTSANGVDPAPLRILIDGAVYGVQRHGGINTYFNEVVARLARRPDTAVEVLLPLLPLSRPPRDRRVRLPRLVRQALFEPEFLPAREKEIRQRYRAEPWGETAASLLGHIERHLGPVGGRP
jgi:hypothetical protein